jgi:dipeptidyl aminopeptidase/acylaminoacyl peptidase
MVKSKIEIEDLRNFTFISDPQISPNGEQVAFVHTTIDYDNQKYVKHLWMLNRKTKETEQFTSGPGSDSHPRWSPDGKQLLFISRGRHPRSKRPQLYVIPTCGGEARPTTCVEGGVMKPIWAPDAKRILFLSRVWTEGKPDSDVLVVKRLKYKYDSVGIFAGTRPHLFKVEVGSSPVQLTEGEFDIDAVTWSPDGRRIALVTNTAALLGDPYTDVSVRGRWPEPVHDPDLSYLRDIYLMSAEGGELEMLTRRKHVIRDLSWAPGGEEIAFLGHDFRRVYMTNTEVWVVSLEDGAPVNLTGSFDRDIGIGGYGPPLSDVRVPSPDPGVIWSSDASYLYFMAMDIPTANIYRVSRLSGEVVRFTEGVSVCGFSLSGNGDVLAYTAMDSVHPAELYVRDGAGDVRVTRFNDGFLDGLRLSVPERFTFTNELSREVDGWIMRPVDFEKGGKYPVILEMHGGRVLCYGDAMFHQFQVWAANGFAVIYTNARGSGGYGEDYRYAGTYNQAVLEFKDTMDFVDAVLGRFDYIDPDRMGVTGGSYGGYMTNWIISHTDRFKAAVACRSTINRVSKTATGDHDYMNPDRFAGNDVDYITNREKHMAHSPLTFVKNVKTPTMIIHSEHDLRVPISEGEQWFVALKLHNVPVEFVRFPNETHDLSRSGSPKHREERLQHMLRWLKKYLQ